ncbi:DUF6221 family protein [Streptomyces sp. NPDC047868]|uniref:DUF6221 family protein n=1 Tax=Streptomyces sp. NPDC047868 TaxID=3155480 RepID=UPI003456619A
MTGPGEDILAWTDAAISTAERTAREAAEAAEGDSWEECNQAVYVSGPGGDLLAEGVMYGDLFDPVRLPVVLHMVLNDPESVLRRCAADRKILDLHTPQQDGSGIPGNVQCRTCSQGGGDGYLYLVYAPCATILALAEGYGWTGGDR